MAKIAVADMSGIEKAAVLMMSLGVDASAEVLKRLAPEEVRTLSTTIAALRNLDDKTRAAVLDEFAKVRAIAVKPPAKAPAPRPMPRPVEHPVEERNFAAEIVDHSIKRERVEVSFEDIGKLDDLSVKDILKNVDFRTLCIAVKAADDDVKEILFRNMTEREAGQIRSEVLEIGPVKLSQVEVAQEQVTDVMRRILNGGRKAA